MFSLKEYGVLDDNAIVPGQGCYSLEEYGILDKSAIVPGQGCYSLEEYGILDEIVIVPGQVCYSLEEYGILDEIAIVPGQERADATVRRVCVETEHRVPLEGDLHPHVHAVPLVSVQIVRVFYSGTVVLRFFAY